MLTGNVRFRTTWTGKLVYQVEYLHTTYDAYGGPEREFFAWRDAKVEDLTIVHTNIEVAQ